MNKELRMNFSRKMGLFVRFMLMLFLVSSQAGIIRGNEYDLEYLTDDNTSIRSNSDVEIPETDKMSIGVVHNSSSKFKLQQQLIKVTGYVVDARTRGSIPGVNVIIKGTTTGVITDIDGNYSIDAPANASLQYSFVGYEQQTIEIRERREIDVVLEASVMQMDEVVIVGYGKQSKITTTGSIGTVSSEEIENTASATIGDAISGKLTGVATVQSVGQPGASDPDIYLRGIGTMNNNDPLFIIDGIPNTGREFMQLNPANISSISVLKDASATAVYGVRGANGVIIVSTKRGVAGKTKITADINYGMQVPTNLPDYVDSYDWGLVWNESYTNDGDLSKIIPDDVLMHYKNQDIPLIYTSHDWVEEFFENSAPQYQANINISGGSDKVKYFSSVGYFKQDGLLAPILGEDQNWSYDRFNLQTNVDLSVTQTTKISFTSSARVSVQKQPGDGGEFWGWINSAAPMATVGIVDGSPYGIDEDIFVTVDRDRYSSWTSTRDPLVKGLSNKGYVENKQSQLNINMDFRQKMEGLIPALVGLEFRTKVGYRSGYNERLGKGGPLFPTFVGRFNKDVVNPNPDLGDDDVVLVKTAEPGLESWNYGYGNNRYIYLEAGFDYQKTIGNNSIGALLLYNQNKNYYPNLAFSNIPSGNVGMVGRITYDYNQQYLLEFNLGYNGSENFAKENRFGWFPSVSAGWVISQEDFMKSLGFVDFMKLRASYGIVGDDQAGGNARFIYIGDSFDPNVNKYYGYNFGNSIPEFMPGIHEASIGNRDVTWETAAKQNYGLDIQLFDRRLSLNVDYFYEYRDDILIYRQSAPTWLSVDLPPVNLGEVENKGFEVELGWSKKEGDFRYNISGNFSRARNKIIFMDEVPPREPYQTITGHPLGAGNGAGGAFGHVWLGFYTEEDIAEIEAGTLASPANVQVQPGDMKYEDLNGDGIIDLADTKVIGDPPTPQMTGGMNADFSYKGFDLSIGLQGVAQVSRNLEYVYQDPFGANDGSGFLQTFADYAWTPERAENGTVKWPRHSFTNDSYNNRPSTFWNRNSSYLRLKRAELGYTINKDVCKRIGLDRIRVYVRTTNLFTLTYEEFNMIDPERKPGQTSMQHPLMKNFMAGMSLSF